VFAGAEIDKENLIFLFVDEVFEEGLELRFFSRVQIAFENGKLEVVAPVAAGFENALEAFFVADVVADEVGAAHGGEDGGWRRGDFSG